MKNLFWLILTIFTLSSCETKEKCEDILCTSPIPWVGLNIIGPVNGENVFTSGTYKLEDVTLFNEEDETLVVQLDSDNHLISPIGEIAGNNKYRLILSPEFEILMEVNVLPADGSCCSTPSLESFNVMNYEFGRTDGRTYKIFLE